MVDLVAESSFPRVARYLARLPHGFSSYPACTVHAGVLHTLAFSRTLRRFPWAQAQPEVADALRGGVSGITWVSEVLFNAVVLTLADHQRYSDDEVVAWMNEANLRLLGVKPRRETSEDEAAPMLEGSLRRATERFGDFHRGVGLGFHVRGEQAFAHITYPPFALDPLIVRGVADALLVGLRKVYRLDPRITEFEIGPRQAEFQIELR